MRDKRGVPDWLIYQGNSVILNIIIVIALESEKENISYGKERTDILQTGRGG